MKAVVAAFNQVKALVGAFSVIVQPVVEPINRFAALVNLPLLIYNGDITFMAPADTKRSFQDQVITASPETMQQ